MLVLLEDTVFGRAANSFEIEPGGHAGRFSIEALNAAGSEDLVASAIAPVSTKSIRALRAAPDGLAQSLGSTTLRHQRERRWSLRSPSPNRVGWTCRCPAPRNEDRTAVNTLDRFTRAGAPRSVRACRSARYERGGCLEQNFLRITPCPSMLAKDT